MISCFENNRIRRTILRIFAIFAKINIMHRIILNGGQIILNDEQINRLSQLEEQNGRIFAKHLPDSSVFKSKKGTWKAIWISEHGEDAWPHSTDNMISTCHIVDVKTRKVYLYPKSQSENASIEGHEDEFIFLADKSLLTPFNLEDVDGRDLDESPEVLLKRALGKISFL